MEITRAQEDRLRWWFSLGAPRGSLGKRAQDAPPPAWRGERLRIPRAAGGTLAAIRFSHDAPRGLVVFGHPALPAGKGWFHRNDRVPFVLGLGFAALTWDYGGYGESDPANALWHREWLDVLAHARAAFPHEPLHVWGVSMGGYFAHHALAQAPAPVASAVFEHVHANMFEYGSGARRLAGRALALALPREVAWFRADAHAPRLRAGRVLYVSGARDAFVRPADADALWRAARAPRGLGEDAPAGKSGPRGLGEDAPASAPGRAEHVVVEDAGHMEAWRLGGERVREAVRGALTEGPRPPS